MDIDKIGKKLPEEIIALIELESASKGISKQEIIAGLVSAVKGADQAAEIKQLSREIGTLEKIHEEDKKEIKFLRDEVITFSAGLTSLAANLGDVNSRGDLAAINSLSEEISILSSEIKDWKNESSAGKMTVIERHLPLIMVSVLAALLLIYLIVNQVMH